MHFFTMVILPEEVQPGCSEKELLEAVNNLIWLFNYKSAKEKQGWLDYYSIGGEFDGVIVPQAPLPAPPPKGLLEKLRPPQAPDNVAPVSDIIDEWNNDLLPDVIITPDGKDHGSNEWVKDNAAYWAEFFLAILKKYPTHLVAGIDCHAGD